MLVVLLSTFAHGKKGTESWVQFTGDRKRYQEIPDKYFAMTTTNKKGEEVKLLKPGIDYLTVDMVEQMVKDKKITPIGNDLLKKSLEESKGKAKETKEVKK